MPIGIPPEVRLLILRHPRSFLATGIVPRLRIVFLAIGLALVSAMLVGFTQIKSLNQSVNDLTVSSVSVFVKTEETERRLKNLLLVLGRVESANHLSQLAPLEHRVHSEMSRIRSDTTHLAQSEASQEMIQKMSQALDEIEAGASKILAAKEAMLVRDTNLAALVSALGVSREVTRTILEGMSYEAAAATDREFETRRNGNQLAFGQIEMLYHRNLILANTITELALGLESVIDTAVGLRNALSLDEIGQLEDTLRFKIRNIALQGGQLPDSAERAELATEVSKIRGLLFDETGIVNQVAELRRQGDVLETYSTKQHGPIEYVSTVSNQLTQAARDNLEQARRKLEHTTGRMTLTLAAATLMSLLTIGIAMVFVVERQINRRMARLTRAVLAIADGQTGYEVDVTGPDELGRMANALDVFKLNADSLRRSNTELEKFAYVAAHDLRSPLRAIQDLAEWTVEDTDNKFSQSGLENMQLLQSRIERLSRLLADLLEYSRAGKESDDVRDVSLSRIVQDTAEMLDPEDRFQITHSGTCDDAETYATPLRQVLLNLVSNSIKHHDQTHGRIVVETHLVDGRIQCSVQDDGPGIDPKYHDRIFDLFQTLRPRDEVEGSGLGLAIIYKLIERYEGSIGVQSDPRLGRGSRFFFDMPETSGRRATFKQAA